MKRRIVVLFALMLLAACSDPSGPGAERSPSSGETSGENDPPADSTDYPYDY